MGSEEAKAEFTIEPFTEGDPGPHVKEPINVAEQSGLDVEVGPFGTTVIGDQEKVFELVSDLVKTAIENGAKSVMAIATHPVLSGPAIKRLQDAPIDKIIVSDTIDISNNKIFNKLEIVSVAEVFAEAIIRINKGDSISELFK